MKLKSKCPRCGKEIKGVQSQFISMGKLHLIYFCGHLEIQDALPGSEEIKQAPVQAPAQENLFSPPNGSVEFEPDTWEEMYERLDRWVSEGGAYKKSQAELDAIAFWESYEKDPIWKSIINDFKAYRYQYEGVRFAEAAQLKCLIGDSVGLGKTIQALLCIKRNYDITRSTLVLTRGSIIFQWAHEFKVWVNDHFSGVMPVVDRINLIPGFHTYIMSTSLLSRKGVLDLLKKLKIKMIILDEVQDFKEDDSERTKALIKLIEQNKIEFRLALSGTAIKNRLSEYFTILNILDPKNFYSRSAFQKEFLTSDERGVYSKLNPDKAAKFFTLTSKYIIRREKEQVLKDLPPLTRDYQLIEIDDPVLRETYNHEIGLMRSFLEDKKKEDRAVDSQQILGWLAKLRAITGKAKASYAVEWTEEFLKSNDESLTIGIHHNSVKDTLYNVFRAKKFNPLKLSGEDNAYAKERIAREFNEGKNRVLILNALAGGVGLNLQSCANALVLERQWNSADEEQFEGRFHRNGQTRGVTITYLIAKGTVDEFFHDMVWKKRSILAGVNIGKGDDETTSLKFLKEFAEFVASRTI